MPDRSGPTASVVCVKVAEMAASKLPGDVLATASINSCVGLCLYEPSSGVAGLAHILLPQSRGAASKNEDSAGKYGDTAVPELVRRMEALGADPSALRAVLAGGADGIAFGGRNPALAIGRRNVEATKEALVRHGIEPVAQEVGGARARTLGIDVATGRVWVQVIGEEPRDVAAMREAS